MKKLIRFIAAVIVLVSLTGCGESAKTPSDGIPGDADTPSTKATEPVTVCDYTVTGMMNVTETNFRVKNDVGAYVKVDPKVETPTAVSVRVTCPECHDEQFLVIQLSEIPESNWGLTSFTWSDDEICTHSENHKSGYNLDFNYSILFTRNK